MLRKNVRESLHRGRPYWRPKVHLDLLDKDSKMRGMMEEIPELYHLPDSVRVQSESFKKDSATLWSLGPADERERIADRRYP